MFSNGMSKTAIVPLLALLMTGCAANQTRVNNDENRYAMADSESALGYEESDWNAPFWERWMEKARSEGRASAQRDAQATTGAANAEVPAVAMSASRSTGDLRPKIGVYIAPHARETLLAYRLINALDARAATEGLVLVEPDELDDAVAGSKLCQADTPAGCPKLLSIYPGLRQLLIVELSDTTGGSTRVTTTMIDADFEIEYEPTTTRINATNQESGVSDAEVWSDRLLSVAGERARIAQWFTHAFAFKDQDMYISAGKASGLDVGDTLAAPGEGAIIRSPAGRIVAWEPGTEEGRVRVTQLIGQDLAVVEHVSGRMPTPEDRLLRVDETE